MMASFEAIFATAQAHDLQLNNLYQMPDGIFRANFRAEPGWFSPMSENADPCAALEAALTIALAKLAKQPKKSAATVIHEHRTEAESRGLFD